MFREYERVLQQTWPWEELVCEGVIPEIESPHILKLNPNIVSYGEKLKSYEKLFMIVTGFSGAGKDSIVSGLVKTGHFELVVTHTTRPKRPGEENGVDYWFVDKELFEDKKRAGDFIESTEYGKHMRGIDRKVIDQCFHSNKIPILRVDPSGAGTFREFWESGKLYPQYGLISIFVTPESFENLEERLIGRDKYLPEVQARMNKVIDDIRGITQADYIIVNTQGELNEVVNGVCKLVEETLQLMPNLSGQSHICI